MPLQTLLDPMRGVERFRRYLATEILPTLDPTVVVYGELMCRGTATSKTSKFNYEKRGFTEGNFYAFGLAVYFEGLGNISSFGEIEKAREVMSETTGLTVLRNDDGFLCKLSAKLSQLFLRFGLR